MGSKDSKVKAHECVLVDVALDDQVELGAACGVGLRIQHLCAASINDNRPREWTRSRLDRKELVEAGGIELSNPQNEFPND